MSTSGAAENCSNFGKLPDVILAKILLALPSDRLNVDKQNCRLVCQRWCSVIDHPSNDIVGFTADLSDDNLNEIMSTCLTFRRLTLTNLTIPLLVGPEYGNVFPTIQTVCFSENVSGENIIKFLQSVCEQIQGLSIFDDAMATVDLSEFSRIVPQIKWNHLTHLTFSTSALFVDRGPSGRLERLQVTQDRFAMEHFFNLATVPALRTLNFDIKDGEKNFYPQIQKLVKEFYGFLNRHANCLKNLGIIFEVVKGGRLPAQALQPASSVQNKLNLDSFYILLDKNSIALMDEFVWENWTLKMLDFRVWRADARKFTHHQSQHINRFIERLLTKPSQQSLTQLTIFCSYKLDLCVLQHLPCLRYLTIFPCFQLEPLRFWLNPDPPKFYDVDTVIVPLAQIRNVKISTMKQRQQYIDSDSDLQLVFADWIHITFPNIQEIIIAHSFYKPTIEGLSALLSVEQLRKITLDGNFDAKCLCDICELCDRTAGLTYFRKTRPYSFWEGLVGGILCITKNLQEYTCHLKI